MTTRWGLIEEPSFEKARDALGINVRRLDELLTGVTWLIARDGDGDQCVEIDGIRLVKATMPGTQDLIRVWFTLDDTTKKAFLIHVDIETRETDEDLPW